MVDLGGVLVVVVTGGKQSHLLVPVAIWSRTEILQNSRDFWGEGELSKDHFGSQGEGSLKGPKKDHIIF